MASTPTPTSSNPVSKPNIPVSYATPNATAVASPLASPEVAEAQLSPQEQMWIGATLLKGEEVERYRWDETAVDFSGFGLAPVSLTIGNFDGGIRMYAEFRNITDATLIVPMLDFEAQLEGKGFGSQRAWGDEYQVLPGETATFTGLRLYDGAVLIEDWDTFTITFVPYFDMPELSTDGLRLQVEEGKLYNDGAQDKTNIEIEGIMRDSDGVYLGMCHFGNIRATVPAGLFVRIPETLSLNLGPVSTCASHGAGDFSERLGTNPVSTTEFVLTVPRP